jgi:hypothetical protein
MYVAGQEGSAVRLTSTSVITVPDGAAFDVTRLTIAAWVRLDAAPLAGDRAMVFDNNEQWAFFVHTQGVGCTGAGKTLTPGTGLLLGRWYHVACVYNGSTLAAFLDGVKLEELTAGTLDVMGSGGARIGANIPDNNNLTRQLFVGSIDDLQLYDAAFDDAMICALAGAC